jgi:hypothetical protein
MLQLIASSTIVAGEGVLFSPSLAFALSMIENGFTPLLPIAGALSHICVYTEFGFYSSVPARVVGIAPPTVDGLKKLEQVQVTSLEKRR